MVKDLSAPYQDLVLVRAQLGRSLRTLSTLCEQIGKTPLPDDWPDKDDYDVTLVGEVLYMAMHHVAMVQEMSEDMSNYLRRLDGKEPFAYPDSESRLFYATLEEAIKRDTVRYVERRRDGGSPV